MGVAGRLERGAPRAARRATDEPARLRRPASIRDQARPSRIERTLRRQRTLLWRRLVPLPLRLLLPAPRKRGRYQRFFFPRYSVVLRSFASKSLLINTSAAATTAPRRRPPRSFLACWGGRAAASATASMPIAPTRRHPGSPPPPAVQAAAVPPRPLGVPPAAPPQAGPRGKNTRQPRFNASQRSPV